MTRVFKISAKVGLSVVLGLGSQFLFGCATHEPTFEEALQLKKAERIEARTEGLPTLSRASQTR